MSLPPLPLLPQEAFPLGALHFPGPATPVSTPLLVPPLSRRITLPDTGLYPTASYDMAAHVNAALSLICGLVLLLSAGVPLADAKLLSGGCIPAGTFNPNRNYFSTAFFSQGFAQPGAVGYQFTVEYHNYYKVVRDLFADTYYVLYQCGAPRPPSTVAPVSAVFLQIPLTKFAISDDVEANYLQLLGTLGSIKIVPPYTVVEPCFQRVAINLAPVPASQVSTIPVFSAYFDPTAYRGLNISLSPTFEGTPLKRAEWIKYISLFFNKEDRAANLYGKIAVGYYCIKKRALAAKGRKPIVAWMSYYSSSWTLSATPYKLQYVTDAGGVNAPEATSPVTYNLPKDAAALKAMLRNVDVVLDESYLPSGPPGYSLAQFKANIGISPAEEKNFRFLRTTRFIGPRVWSVYGQYTAGSFLTGWFEGAVAQPQEVLKELQVLLRPSLGSKNFKFKYFYNVASGKPIPVNAQQCKVKNIFAGVDPTSVRC